MSELAILQAQREARAMQPTLVAGVENLPGINAAMGVTPEIGMALRGVAQQLLVEELPGSTLSRGQRELLATGVSAGNGCFFCMDSHAAFAKELLRREGVQNAQEVVQSLKVRSIDELEPKMQALMNIAQKVRGRALDLTKEDVQVAVDSGATNQDVELSIMIASAFSMFNRLVDGFGAVTPPNEEMYAARAVQIVDNGYLPKNAGK